VDIFGTILWPIKWVIEAVLVLFHSMWTAFGLNPADGLTWILSILGLVIVVRAALIPLFVRQIRSQRKMLEIAPELKKIQEKYKGKRDQFSREAMSRETMELYKRTGTNPFSSCLPLLLQMPIFFSLFEVLNRASRESGPGIGMLNATLSHQFGQSVLFGAPLKETIGTANGNVLVIVIGVGMIALMTASQFVTQLQIMAKNISEETKASPMYRQQRVLLYVLPLVFIFSGIAFPLGVMFYWVFSNVWTMVQQFIVIREMPTPGSQAAKEREERLARRAQRRGAKGGAAAATPVVDTVAAPAPRVNTQRQQPVSKNRAKRTGERRA
jgi:YidC/Oxa1 family membrane protein insertase